MKLKNKGKVHPSPSSSSSSSAGEDYLSILKLLPQAILALASVLSLEDREVLAYMTTRSLKTTTNSGLIDTSSKKRSSKKPPPTVVQKTGALAHKPPAFDCDCFDCYTSYWFRWDSSPNRELIHQVIEAFEEHLTNGEVQKPAKKNTRPKKRDNNSKTVTPVPDVAVVNLPQLPEQEGVILNCSGLADEAPGTVDDVTPTVRDDKEQLADVSEMTEKVPVAEDVEAETRPTAASCSHRGLARKVLPDVLGLFNSRLWGLWNPNM